MLYDLIIIGAGPAGITASIYAVRQKLKTLLISKDIGGQMAKKAVAIENYPGFENISGLDLVKRFEKHLKSYHIKIEKAEVADIKRNENGFLVFAENKKRFEAKAVIIASGADPRPLEVLGEKEFLGKGLSYCAVCDGAFFSDKITAVVGGGDSGFETALFLSKIAKKIYILEYSDKLGADKANQAVVKRTGKIKIITNAAVKQIRGKKFVQALIYQDRKTKQEKTLNVQGVFVEIGYQPATSFVKGMVSFNKKDEIKINPSTCETKTPGLFAAGDVSQGPFKQIVIAMSQGAKAALSAFNYLQRNFPAE